MPIFAKDRGAHFRLNTVKDVWEISADTDTGERITMISRQLVFEHINEASKKIESSIELTREEEADLDKWMPQTLKQAVEDRFVCRDFTWAEMERWIEGCYAMDINPLPAIRRILNTPEIPLRYEVGIGSTLDVGLLCTRVLDSIGGELIALTAFGTLKELEQKVAERERMLKIADID